MFWGAIIAIWCLVILGVSSFIIFRGKLALFLAKRGKLFDRLGDICIFCQLTIFPLWFFLASILLIKVADGYLSILMFTIFGFLMPFWVLAEELCKDAGHLQSTHWTGTGYSWKNGNG